MDETVFTPSNRDIGQDPPTREPPSPGPTGPPEDPTPTGVHARRWRKHKGFALLVGALAGGLAGYANSTIGITLGLPFALYSEGAFLAFLLVVVAPLVEEHVKLFSLVLLSSEEQARYSPRRWMVLGALSGIGFGLAEAALYWQALLAESLLVANLNLSTRLLMTVPFHGLTVTASAYGYGLARAQGRSMPLIRGLVIAILLHAAFNGFQVLKAIGVFS